MKQKSSIYVCIICGTVRSAFFIKKGNKRDENKFNIVCVTFEKKNTTHNSTEQKREPKILCYVRSNTFIRKIAEIFFVGFVRTVGVFLCTKNELFFFASLYITQRQRRRPVSTEERETFLHDDDDGAFLSLDIHTTAGV
jgi:hypothetical protein